MVQVIKKGQELARLRGRLFTTPGFLNILGVSTHFPASHVVEKTESKIQGDPSLASHHIPSSSLLSSQLLGFEESPLCLSSCW